MQECHLPRRCLEQHEAVVLYRHVPVVRVRESAHIYKLAQEPPGQINQVNSLIEQLPTAGPLRLGAPLALVSKTPAVSIASPHKQQWPQDTLVNQASGVLKCPVIAVIETNADADIAPRRPLREPPQLIGTPSRRLFNEYVFTGIDRSTHNLSKQIVRGSDDDRLHLRLVNDLPPVRAIGTTIYLRSNGGCTLVVRINTVDQPGTRQMLGPAPTDQTTTDNCNVQSRFPHLR